MHRFFISPDNIPIITGSDMHHIKDVLRMKTGDTLELLDGTGNIYNSKISEIKKDQIVCEIVSRRTEESEPLVKVTIAQCLPKGKKMDLIMQKCTELGAHKFIPTLSERSIAKGEKLERWRKIVKEAAEQSARAIIPQISALTNFEDVLKLKDDYDLAIIPWELEKDTALKSILRSNLQPPDSKILIVIGPEGGFSHEEILLAQKAGFTSVSLGKRILRTETAAIVLLANIMYEKEQ
jgi:16S rRNA (uracil1498-N3)-methyltransferase